ncbi:MAG: RsbRD N-terminal domain-containing protein [Desulfobulbaceae bacterium]|nr:RsbRD N-terminal domain-containing protein [Desulfobulbaceae bacterium]
MHLLESLENYRDKIVSLWVERTLDGYSSGFFKKSKDLFANPVGVNIKQGLTELFQLLITDADPDAYRNPLDKIVRIRAVQDFAPSQALAPILELKWVVRQVFSSVKEERPLVSEMDAFDCNIDRAALMAFDIYIECRERLYQTRINELKSGTHILTDSPCPSKLLKKDQPVPDTNSK